MTDSPINHPALKKLPALSLEISREHPIFNDLEGIMNIHDGRLRPWILTFVPSDYGEFATAYLERQGSPPHGILIFDIYGAPHPRQAGEVSTCRRILRRESGKVYELLSPQSQNPHRIRVDEWLNSIVREYDSMPSQLRP